MIFESDLQYVFQIEILKSWNLFLFCLCMLDPERSV